MLSVTRKVGEYIKIGDDIIVVVQRRGKGGVRLGIVAPKDVKIWRGDEPLELPKKKRKKKKPGRQKSGRGDGS